MFNQRNKTLVFSLLTFVFLVLTTVLISKTFTKENFQMHSLSYGDDPSKININDSEGYKKADLDKVTEYIVLQNPVPGEENLIFLKFDQQSKMTLLRKEENLESEFTFGFYFANHNVLTNIQDKDDPTQYNDVTNFIKITDEDDQDVLSVDLKQPDSGTGTGNELKFKFSDSKITDTEISFKADPNNYLSYIVIELNYKGDDFIPELVININNKRQSFKLTDFQAQKLSCKKIIISSGVLATTELGYVGNVTLFNKVIDKFTLCKNYNCDTSCFIPCEDEDKDAKGGTVCPSYDGNVNGCIKKCMESCNDIKRCQNICVNCEVEGEFWDEAEKKRRCPWLKEIKITDMTIPDAPEIRGFPGDRSILIEWKKPFDGRGEISNYIIMYYESFDKSNGVQVSISGNANETILEHPIKNLKNRTYYDIVVRAVNTKGIGKPSNIITLAPNGEVIQGSGRDIFTDLENEVDREVDNMKVNFICENSNFDSQGHTLDYYDESEMDIEKYIKNIK